MVGRHLSRRICLTGIAATLLATTSARAMAYKDLKWSDLLPEGQAAIPPAIAGLIQHDGPDLSGQQPPSLGVRTEWNGEVVRLPGFMVPLDYSSTGVTAFILVPFVGACIHVPPPPANQLVFVTTETPYENSQLFEAVNVTGVFGTVSTSTELGDIAYALSAGGIERF